MFFISLFVIVFGGGKFWIIEFDFFFFVYQNIKYIFVDNFIINFILFVCLMYGFIEVLQNIEFEGILIDFVLNIFWVVFKKYCFLKYGKIRFFWVINIDVGNVIVVFKLIVKILRIGEFFDQDDLV